MAIQTTPGRMEFVPECDFVHTRVIRVCTKLERSDATQGGLEGYAPSNNKRQPGLPGLEG